MRVDQGTETLALADEVLATPALPGAEEARRIAIAHIAAPLVFFGQVERAEWAAAALDVTGASGVVLANMERAASVRALKNGELASLLRNCERYVAEFERVGDSRRAVAESANLGYTLCLVGLHERAVEVLERTCESARTMGMAFTIAAASENLGFALTQLGRLAEAKRAFETALAASPAPRMEGGNRAISPRPCCSTATPRERMSKPRVPSRCSRVPRIDGGMRLPPSRGSSSRAAITRVRAKLPRKQCAALPLATRAKRQSAWSAQRCSKATGNHDAARATIATARARLLERAAKISDAALRESFLTNVRDNARTFALANLWNAK